MARSLVAARIPTKGKSTPRCWRWKRPATRARGATLYLNLEPCTHVGRTGPCADALIAAGVKRVFAAMRDPNPLVSGRGLAKLRAAGIEVSEGLCETEAKKLNEAFAKYIRHKTPFVTLKTAMTLDGKIAPPPGESEQLPDALAASGGWITSEEARAHVHEMRHANDAIMVGRRARSSPTIPCSPTGPGFPGVGRCCASFSIPSCACRSTRVW